MERIGEFFANAFAGIFNFFEFIRVHKYDVPDMAEVRQNARRCLAVLFILLSTIIVGFLVANVFDALERPGSVLNGLTQYREYAGLLFGLVSSGLALIILGGVLRILWLYKKHEG